MKKNIAIIFIILGLAVSGAFFLSARNGGQPSGDVATEKIEVVASFYPLYFIASEIGGGRAAVSGIVPAGAEPHEYEPTARDMAKMENSRLIILNGAGLEAWGKDIEKNIDAGKTTIIRAGEGLATRQMERDGQMKTDPHIWLDPVLVWQMTDKIAQGFQQADPENADYYVSNAEVLKSRLDGLDQEYRQGLGDCAGKNIITAHNAFSYLAAAYGFNQVAIAGLSPDAEPSLRDLAGISRFARDNGVRYIFFESLASPKLSQTIADEVGAQTLVLNPIEGLDEEELSQGKDYFTVMRENLANLQTALECSK
ncbi:MAG: zinc ABC transporter substrate-binding protein [Candidatus Moranbacteria bacterium]|nr:zinc ABC transporter substrate-binding protein [Candidatus Moranbacteria bacterium]